MKNKIKENIELIKKALSKFPITDIAIMLFSITLIFYMDDSSKILEIVLWFLMTFAALSYYFESRYSSKLKIYQYVLLALLPTIISVSTTYDIFYKGDFFIRFIIWYFALLILLSIYYNYKKSKKKFSLYLVNVFSNLLEVFITNFILMIGTISIVLIFDTLILGGTNIDYLGKILILEMGFYYLPSIIFCFSNIKEPSNFVKTLITRVLYTLVLVAYLIIYIYIFKIIITFNIPSNQIFRITAILFIVSTPIYLMKNALEANKMTKMNKIYIYLFIPFILLQIYSLGIRIYDYGFTIPRYLGVMLIIFEIIYILISLLNKPIEKVVILILVQLTISLIIPFINCLDFSIINQMSILNKYKNIDLYKARSAYEYLNEYDKGKDKIKILLTKDEEELITNYNYLDYDKRLYVYSSKFYDDLDISSYSKLLFLDSISYEKYKSSFIIDNENVNKVLLEALPRYINNSDNIDEYFYSNNEIIINENQKLILTNISIEIQNDIIEYANFSGYLLER